MFWLFSDIHICLVFSGRLRFFRCLDFSNSVSALNWQKNGANEDIYSRLLGLDNLLGNKSQLHGRYHYFQPISCCSLRLYIPIVSPWYPHVCWLNPLYLHVYSPFLFVAKHHHSPFTALDRSLAWNGPARPSLVRPNNDLLICPARSKPQQVAVPPRALG